MSVALALDESRIADRLAFFEARLILAAGQRVLLLPTLVAGVSAFRNAAAVSGSALLGSLLAAILGRFDRGRRRRRVPVLDALLVRSGAGLDAGYVLLGIGNQRLASVHAAVQSLLARLGSLLLALVDRRRRRTLTAVSGAGRARLVPVAGAVAARRRRRRRGSGVLIHGRRWRRLARILIHRGRWRRLTGVFVDRRGRWRVASVFFRRRSRVFLGRKTGVFIHGRRGRRRIFRGRRPRRRHRAGAGRRCHLVGRGRIDRTVAFLDREFDDLRSAGDGQDGCRGDAELGQCFHLSPSTFTFRTSVNLRTNSERRLASRPALVALSATG